MPSICSFPLQSVPLGIDTDTCMTRDGLQLEAFLRLGTSFGVHVVLTCLSLICAQSSLKSLNHSVHKAAKFSLAEV